MSRRFYYLHHRQARDLATATRHHSAVIRAVAIMTSSFELGTGMPVSRRLWIDIPRGHPTVPDYLFPGYSDAPLYDIVRQATEGNFTDADHAYTMKPEEADKLQSLLSKRTKS